jgi:zinc ribbon protein
MYCPHCGTAVESSASYCVTCGKQLTDGTPLVVATQPAIDKTANLSSEGTKQTKWGSLRGVFVLLLWVFVVMSIFAVLMPVYYQLGPIKYAGAYAVFGAGWLVAIYSKRRKTLWFVLGSAGAYLALAIASFIVGAIRFYISG